MCIRFSMIFIFYNFLKISPGQIEPYLDVIVLGSSSSKIVSDGLDRHSFWVVKQLQIFFRTTKLNETKFDPNSSWVVIFQKCLYLPCLWSKMATTFYYATFFSPAISWISYIVYSKTCLNRTPLGPKNLFCLDRCLVYTGSNYIDI